MQKYETEPMTSHVDRLQKTVRRSSLTFSKTFLYFSYRVVVLINIVIGLKRPMVENFCKSLHHAVRAH